MTIIPTEPPPYPHCGRGADADDPVGCRGRRVARMRPESHEAGPDSYETCLAHLDGIDRHHHLSSLHPGTDLDHRGTIFNAALLGHLLDAVRDPTDGRPHFGAVRFDGATFEGDAGFRGVRFGGDAGFGGAMFQGNILFGEVTFEGSAEFRGATFQGDAGFGGATFGGSAGFGGATFVGDAGFRGASFQGDAGFGRASFEGTAGFGRATFARSAGFREASFQDDAGFGAVTFRREAGFGRASFQGDAGFGGATFQGGAGFRRARFGGDAVFRGATFHGSAGFNSATFGGSAAFRKATFQDGAGFDLATFEGDAGFEQASFEGSAGFRGATFQGRTRFNSATFENDALFGGVTFERASQLGPLACRGTVNLSAAVFSSAVTLELAAGGVDCVRTRWASTAALRLRHAVLDLSDAVLEFPVSVAAHPPFIALEEPGTEEPGLVEAPVRVASLHGVDASHLVLTDVDLTNCRFAGTIHLDQLRLHGRCTLPTAPAGLHRRGLVPVRCTSRQTLAEEQHWRAARGQAGAGWTAQQEGQPPLEPAALAPIYRELRKGFEDAKNEPGAADFYYGEMEMRRHDSHGPAAERALLWMYWAASGYGLRASRALGWLLCAMTITVLLMVGFGLPDTPAKPYPPGAGVIGNQNPQVHADFPDRFTTARAQKAADVVINSVVFRSSGQSLTTAGRYTEMASRFTEPVLLALALLAVRGRVKR
ncbi:pentapeptide repeat-containing protein [Streptomyces sp. WMMB 322]|uniref:pentapeptide repeat-containing protein n=1 Tax=Streptomyces sp. WMMB 322 TaxID=1286821 RepID=UPI000823805B|nr:pentapeptide repeat-containing protein [Streptomyces sp. WMMB 322]SCK47154.1 Uncharacterized protein YjbI, contains pentapeptide repeats [Streptomyces sp. WMMB 322]